MSEKKWEKLAPSFSLEDERLDSLKQVVPEAFTDGKVDFDVLRELLGDVVEDESAEHFGLNWTGKREARRLAGMPSKGTLVPVPGKGLHEDTTENIFIEGDNLEVLKLLHKSYRGKIKMIYIDPPYNTGNDFIYKDDYRMPLESYLQRSGQKSDMGELLTSNPKSSGRFHSDWLNMMYPRLRVAKDLLREDGVIFVSIDDNEVHNLRQMMNEIFGEENLISEIVWEKMYTTKNDARVISDCHEYLILFAKNVTQQSIGLLPRTEAANERYTNPDNDPRGPWKAIPLYAKGESRNGRFTIMSPKTGKGFELGPDKHWRYVKEEIERMIADNRIWFGKDGNSYPNSKRFLSEVQQGMKPKTLWKYDEVGSNDSAKKEIKKLFGSDPPFEFPKPVTYIKRMLQLATNADDIVLDFFVGSGTTAQAVYEISLEDGLHRKFICVQIDENVGRGTQAEKMGFGTISDITVERINRCVKSIEKNRDGIFNEPGDLGYHFFRLENSNFKAWSDYQGNDLDELRGLLQAQLDSTFVEGATEDAILTEILLLEGFPLTSKIEIDETFQKNVVRRISHEWSEHRLFITLDKEIQEETIRTVDDMIASDEMLKIDIFICLDNALTDQDKLRLADVCRLKTI